MGKLSRQITPETLLKPEDPQQAPQTAFSKKLHAKQKFSKEDRVSRLEKYEELDRNHPLNKPFQGNPRFRGPVFKRKYTNILFTIFFILCNGAFILYGVVAWKDGDAGRLTNGTDFRAEICGTGKLASRKYTYFASPSTDINVRFCVEECPTSSGQQICLYDVDPTKKTPFCYTQGSATASGRYCYPTEPINKRVVDKYLSSMSNIFRRVAGDMKNSADLIAVGVLLSLLLAAAFLKIMYKPGQIKFVIWGSIWGTVIVCLILALFFYNQYQSTVKQWCIQGIDRHNCGGTTALLWKYLSYGTAGFTFIYIIIIMKLFNNINLGVGTLQATAKCSVVFEQLGFLPYILSIVITIVVCFFLLGVVYGFSVGNIVVIPAKNIDGGYVKTIIFDNTMRYLIGFNLFMLQWWVNVILLFSDSIQSYALSMWFFERRKETVVLPVKKIITSVLKYHSGTIIQIALYKILFRPFRIVLSIFKRLLRAPKQYRNIVRFSQACCVCCIHIYERFFRYQSKYALVQMVMWSESYRFSSKRAWFLLFRHRTTIRNLDGLCTFILFLTKVVCSLFGGLIIYVYITVVPRTIINNKTSDIETPLVPTVIVFYLGFFFASIFQSVLDIANKTLLQCFLMDTEMFVGEQRFANKDVLNFMEYFRPDALDEGKFGKVTQYVKGIKATLDAHLPEHADVDIDDEENKKFDKKRLIKEEEHQSSSGEIDDLEDEEEDDSSSEEESSDSEDDIPELLKGSVFESQVVKGSQVQSNHNDVSVEFGKTMDTGISFTAGNTSSNKLLASLPPVNNKSYLGKSNLSFFGRNEKKDDDKKIDIKPQNEEDEDDSEEEEKSNPLIKGFAARKNEAEKPQNQSLDMSSFVQNQSISKTGRREFLKKRAEDSVMHLNDVSTSSAKKEKVIDKSSHKPSINLKGDTHNIFNKSKIADNTTMKLDYDDDDDGNAKYRL